MDRLLARTARTFAPETPVFNAKQVNDWYANNKMKLLPTSEWHEDLGSSIFVSFSRDENGEILGEPPEISYESGYLDSDFDQDKWTHFIDGDFNFIFSDADPVNFPARI